MKLRTITAALTGPATRRLAACLLRCLADAVEAERTRPHGTHGQRTS